MVSFNKRALTGGDGAPQGRKAILAFVCAILGIFFLWIGYSVELLFNIFTTVASLLLFYSLFLVLAKGPLNDALSRASRYVQRPLGAALFVSYLALHYVLYGFLLEKALAMIYGYSSVNLPPTAYVSAEPLTPPSLYNSLLSVVSVPSFVLWFPPYFGVVLIPYGIFMGFLIALLITANLSVVGEISSCPMSKKVTAMVLLPMLGVVSGASCCLSLPILLTLLIPAVGALTYAASASYFAFFAFPPATAVALAINLSLSKKLLTRHSPPLFREEGMAT